MLTKGIEKSRAQGISDPRVMAPLVVLGEQMSVAHEVSVQVKVSY
jgi:hypothetical protein